MYVPVGWLYLFDVPTFLSSLTNFIQTYASLYPKQVGRKSRWWRGGRLAPLYIISYLMLSVEGSLGLRYLGIGRAGHTRLATLGRAGPFYWTWSLRGVVVVPLVRLSGGPGVG